MREIEWAVRMRERDNKKVYTSEKAVRMRETVRKREKWGGLQCTKSTKRRRGYNIFKNNWLTI